MGLVNNMASFLLDQPSGGGRDIAAYFPALRGHQFFAFVQDKWQVSSKLTLDFGLRWEFYPPPTPAFPGGFSNYNPVNNTLVLAGIGGNPMNMGMQKNWKYFAPRLGISYRLNNATVIRTGYGVSYTPFPDNTYAYNFPVKQNNAYSTGASNFAPGVTPSGVFSMASGFPAPQLAVIPSNGIITNPSLTQSNFVIPLNYKNPYVESWNFSVQRSLALHFTLDVAYVGNHGVRSSATYNLNVPTTMDQAGTGVNGRPEYQQFKRSADTTQYFAGYSSMYNGLQVKLNRRFTNGLAITTAYTLARGMSFQTGDDGGIWNYINPRRSYARTDFDRHQTFVQSYVYDLPFGVGRKWLNHGLAAKTIGGWQINGILTLMTGTPMTFGASGSSLNTPGSSQTADQVAEVTKLYGINTPSKGGSPWFSQASFVQPTGVRFGSSGRNTLSGPGFFNADLSIFKIFNFTEKIKMEIRGESFSVTNTAQFSNPDTSVQDSNYGYITGAGGARGLQVGSEDQLLADGVPQYSHVVEFHFDHIAGRHPSGVARRSCIDQVSRQQSHPPANPTEYGRDIEDQVAGVLLLNRLPIHSRLEQQLAVIDSADDGGTERRECIRPLGAPPLQILLRAVLPLAFADIVTAGDAEDGVRRLPSRTRCAGACRPPLPSRLRNGRRWRRGG